jgi:uncharacterized protein YeaO (DUF488 family)
MVPMMPAKVPAANVKLKRAYERASADDGRRILVDRLWPRGLSRCRAAIDQWMKDIAPSPALRKWFGHDPARWTEFRRRYVREIRHQGELLDELRRLARQGRVTLVYAARDEDHNDAVVLRSEILKGERT